MILDTDLIPMSERGKILQFVKGGNAIFTIQNKETGNRFTYRVQLKKGATDFFFVQVLTSPDNVDGYSYLGFIVGDAFVHGKKSRISADSLSNRAFDWFFRTIRYQELPQRVSFYHVSKCARCGRQLTTPESVTRGLGDDCARILGIN